MHKDNELILTTSAYKMIFAFIPLRMGKLVLDAMDSKHP